MYVLRSFQRHGNLLPIFSLFLSTQLQTQLSVKTAELQGAQSMVSSLIQRLTHAQNSLRGLVDLVDLDEIKQKVNINILFRLPL